MKQYTKGSNSQRTKELNRTLILKLISTQSPISRIDISKQTQLSKMSVTNIVNDLIEKNIVVELQEIPDGYIQEVSAGRTPILLTTNPSVLLSLGVYISRDFVEVALIDISGMICVHQKTAFAIEESNDSFINKITDQIDFVLQQSKTTIDRVLGIGIASIGPVDIHDGIILDPPNFHGLHAITIVDIL